MGDNPDKTVRNQCYSVVVYGIQYGGAYTGAVWLILAQMNHSGGCDGEYVC